MIQRCDGTNQREEVNHMIPVRNSEMKGSEIKKRRVNVIISAASPELMCESTWLEE